MTWFNNVIMSLSLKNLSFGVLASVAEERRQAKAYLATQAPSRKLLVDDSESTKVSEPKCEIEGNKNGGEDNDMGHVITEAGP